MFDVLQLGCLLNCSSSVQRLSAVSSSAMSEFEFIVLIQPLKISTLFSASIKTAYTFKFFIVFLSVLGTRQHCRDIVIHVCSVQLDPLLVIEGYTSSVDLPQAVWPLCGHRILSRSTSNHPSHSSSLPSSLDNRREPMLSARSSISLSHCHSRETKTLPRAHCPALFYIIIFAFCFLSLSLSLLDL